MKPLNKNLIKGIQFVVVLVFFGFVFSFFLITPSKARILENKQSKNFDDQTKYTVFPHETHQLECNSCHKFPSSNWEKVRKEAFPDITDYPKHESCLECHREQFFLSGPKPTICSICHTNPSPNDGSRHPFDNPREIFDETPKGKAKVSDFQIHFAHDKHIDIVSRNENPFEQNRNGFTFFKASHKRSNEDSCKVCHQTYRPQDKSDEEYFSPPPKGLGDAFWLKKGTFKTVPNGHTTCFTCHNTDTGITPAQNECATCHKLKQPFPKADFDMQLAEKIGVTERFMLQSWQKRDSSGAFRHEFFSHADLSCSTCHNVNKMDTLDAKTKKVLVSSCAPCHITATSDEGGILNYEIDSRKKDAKFECVKCHISFGKMDIPNSHLKAISELGKGN
ncbi:MAG: cytochrome c3 family protein [Pyrinomonadaceae bacterium]|nr:cytochrome c3 family protein [Pyrinomonadaceae bacterium]